jgi:hypothetical protein
VLDEEWVARAARPGRSLNDLMDEVHTALDQLGPDATREQLADALDIAASDTSGKTGARIKRLADAVRAEPALCLDIDQATSIERENGTTVVWSQPGLYVLDLLSVHSAAERIRQTGALSRALLRYAKATGQDQPILLVVDEAQNYAPEQNTGRLASARASFEALFEIATEGRKFACGLMVASQRPARVNKDILSQCNTQFIFRMVSVEDLDAVRDCFEGSSVALLEALPGHDTGTCYRRGSPRHGSASPLPRLRRPRPTTTSITPKVIGFCGPFQNCSAGRPLPRSLIPNAHLWTLAAHDRGWGIPVVAVRLRSLDPRPLRKAACLGNNRNKWRHGARIARG